MIIVTHENEVAEQTDRVIRFANRNNVITGGILSTALDMLCGHALHTMHDNRHATIELKTIFLASAYPGLFYGEGNVVKIGKSIGFAESILRNEIESLQIISAPTSSTFLFIKFSTWLFWLQEMTIEFFSITANFSFSYRWRM